MLSAHYYRGLLSEPHITSYFFCVLYLNKLVNWFEKRCSQMVRGKTGALPICFNFLFPFLLTTATTVSETSVCGKTQGEKKSFCLSAVWLLQPQSWQNPLWTKPWGLDIEWIREHIAEYNNWTKGFKSYYKSGDNMACTFEGWSIIKTEWQNVPVPSFYELYCRSNQCGLLGWKHTWPRHSRCVHVMALVNNDYISFQLPFGTFDEHLNLLNADDHICCSSEWGD